MKVFFTSQKLKFFWIAPIIHLERVPEPKIFGNVDNVRRFPSRKINSHGGESL